jgi:TetR/AcrR family transcriptional regulator, regulator of mycofactocin system
MSPADTAAVTDGSGSGPAPGRRERRVRETRRAILETARHLFETNGYAPTTVEQIAAGADVAPRTFFRYFPTKESLLFAHFDEVLREMLASLESRPADEDPLRSLSLVLEDFAEVIDRRRDDLAWGFRMCEENAVDGVYERSMIKEHTNARIAAFVAGRLGVDPDADPRPLAWAMAIMGVFSTNMRAAAIAGVTRSPAETVAAFESLLLDTAEALRSVAGH